MSRATKKELHPVVGIITFIIPLVLQGLFLYHQIKNDILTFWSLAGSGMMVLIFLNAIRMMFGKKEDQPTEEIQGESTVEITGPERKKEFTIMQSIVAVIAIAASIVCFNVYNNKSKGLEAINSQVVHQWGEIVKKTEVDGDEITETEYENIEVTISYEYKGVKHREIIKSGTTSKIYVDELKIYVDENGVLIGTFGQVEVWKYEAIILLVFGVIMALSAIFVLGAGFVAGNIMTCAGVGVFLLIASTFMENALYNDILCFVSVFANIGFYMLLYSVLTLIFVGRKGLAGAITTTTTYVDKLPDLEEEVDEESTFNPDAAPYVPEMDKKPEEPAGNRFCQFCGSEIEAGSKFCDMCGARLNQDGE